MCGIVASVGMNPSHVEIGIQSSRHRGPDASKKIEIDDVVLGHVRLSMVDLNNSADQPFVSTCGQFYVVFNGEIYNHRALRKNLEEKGYKFRTHSDTEVLVNLFIEYGIECFSRLKGMFALIVYDSRAKLLYAVRDQMGIKPLYYHLNGQHLFFASEIKAFPNYAKRRLDRRSKILFLTYGFIPEPLTLYENVQTISPGHISIFRDRKLIKQVKISYDSSVYDDLSVFSHVFTHVVKQTAESDSRIGVLLSGGIDSTVICKVLSESEKSANTISINFEDVGTSEENFQNLVADVYKTNHSAFSIDVAAQKALWVKFLQSMDQPTIDGFNIYVATHYANQLGYKGLLSGAGADELFYGYPSIKKLKWIKHTRRLIRAISWLGLVNKKYQRLSWIKLFEIDQGWTIMRSISSPEQISLITGENLTTILDTVAECIEANLQQGLPSGEIATELDKVMYLRCQLLRDADVFGMSNSIEIRVPFLDQRIVNWNENNLQTISTSPSKKHLKELLFSDFDDTFLNRTKRGFDNPYVNLSKTTSAFDKKIDMSPILALAMEIYASKER